MTSQEKTFLRIMFQNKIFKTEGQAFEDLFTTIMSHSEKDFQQIKPWGRIGDKHCDGYIENKGIYYQVYAPEDIRKSYTDLIQKISKDFKLLIDLWPDVKSFYFVVNDKYKGVNAEAEQTLKTLKKNYNLNECGFFTSADLERLFFTLEEDIIQSIVGFIPDIQQMIRLDVTILNEVIGFIMNLSIKPISGELKFPDWNDKIVFNNLSDYPASLLNQGSQTLGLLNKYLTTNTFLAEELQNHITGVYNSIKENFREFSIKGDHLFWEILTRCSPKQSQPYQMAVITIMAKYFESCDIFEEPPRGE